MILTDSTHASLTVGSEREHQRSRKLYDSAETMDDNDKHYLGHLSGICGFRSEQTPVTPKKPSSARFFFFNRYYPTAFLLLLLFFIYTACVCVLCISRFE